jgi:hypothetical protein
MSSVGRNEACPCGSGKKFKRCCGSPGAEASRCDEPAPGWARVHALWATAVQVLADHFDEWLGPDAVDSALQEFPTHDDEVGESFRMIFDSWRFYDWIGENEDATVASHWLAASELTKTRDRAVIELIRAANAEPISAFQVKSLRPGRGLFIRDLLSGGERFVADRSLSQGVPPHAVLVGRLMTLESITIFDAVAPHPLPPDYADVLVGWFEEDAERHIPVPAAQLRLLGSIVLEAYADALHELFEARQQKPVLHNTSDDLVVLCKETWAIEESSYAAVVRQLDSLGLTSNGGAAATPLVLSWLAGKKHPDPEMVLGHVNVTDKEIALETNSRERRDRLKAELERALAGLVRHTGSVENAPEELVHSEKPASSWPEDIVPPEVAREVMASFLSNYYGRWPEEPLPALGGRTPRQATKTRAGRAELEAIIRDMEYHSHGSDMAEAYDFDDLRKALGLEVNPILSANHE